MEKSADTYVVSAPSPTGIELPGRLQLCGVERLEQFVDVVLLSPGLCMGELHLCLVEVIPARSQKAPGVRRLFRF